MNCFSLLLEVKIMFYIPNMNELLCKTLQNAVLLATIRIVGKLMGGTHEFQVLVSDNIERNRTVLNNINNNKKYLHYCTNILTREYIM